MGKEIKAEKIDCGNDARIFYCRIPTDHPPFLHSPDIQPPSSYAEHRKREWLTVRFLLSQAGVSHDVQYSDNRMPSLPDAGLYLSISHSREYAAVMLSPLPCGVDTEKISERAARIAHRFLDRDEINMIPEAQSDFFYTLFWSAKESLYKITGCPDFRMNMKVISLPGDGKSFGIELCKSHKTSLYRVFYTIFDSHVLTWINER
jgi:4'-phosphopantetheinyl transferase EntD